MIRVQCPHCERRYRTEMEAFGRTAVCTKCHQTFKIGEARPPFEWKSTSLAEDSWIGVEPPEEPVERKHCIICDAPLRPGEIRCPECGANQVTGVVHRSKPKTETRDWSIGNWIPLRSLLALALVGGIAAAAYLAILSITASAVKVGDELADQATAARAAKVLREGGSAEQVRAQFPNAVKPDNLPRFTRMLAAGDSNIRKAAAVLISAGSATDLTPVVEWARENTDRGQVLDALAGIGPRTLIRLSGGEEASAREAAARLLLMHANVRETPESLATLSAATPMPEKIAALNAMCRAWPEATGPFQIIIGQDVAPMTAVVEQIGRTFYLKIGATEFQSEPGDVRAFTIPIERWCAATGAAIDATAVRELLSGTVQLASPIGAGWEGTVEVAVKAPLNGPLPGFLPLKTPTVGQSATGVIRLQRHR